MQPKPSGVSTYPGGGIPASHRPPTQPLQDKSGDSSAAETPGIVRTRWVTLHHHNTDGAPQPAAHHPLTCSTQSHWSVTAATLNLKYAAYFIPGVSTVRLSRTRTAVRSPAPSTALPSHVTHGAGRGVTVPTALTQNIPVNQTRKKNKKPKTRKHTRKNRTQNDKLLVVRHTHNEKMQKNQAFFPALQSERHLRPKNFHRNKNLTDKKKTEIKPQKKKKQFPVFLLGSGW